VFEQLFSQVLACCREAGLLDGSRLIVDGTHVEADAALKSLRAELEVIAGGGESSEQIAPQERPGLEVAPPRSGPTPKRKASNRTLVSGTDPDAKLRFKPGHRPHLVHRAQVATDPKARVIVAVLAESAAGHEAENLPVIIDRARWLRHKVAEIVTDAGYASGSSYELLDQLGITAHIPPGPQMTSNPHGIAARARARTPIGVQAAIERRTHGEGAISELKRHGAGRARCRGRKKLQIQLLLAATAINLKRLINQPAAAENAVGERDHTKHAQIAWHLTIINACLAALGATEEPTSTTAS
jgi:hypothetical protein